ncbi:MAG: DUF6049 family protein [Streptosporangiaceae bacterium]
MRGLLSEKVKRRIVSRAAALTGAIAIPAAVMAVGLAAAPAAQADAAAPGRVSVTITAMTPQVAGPDTTVRLTGTVTNGTRQTQAGLEVQLLTSPTRFSARDSMDSYLAHGSGASLEAVGQLFVLPASVAPGQTATWSASFGVSAVGMAEFGVYPVAAQLQDFSGDVLGSAQTLLPYWPGQHSGVLSRPLSISWAWPLIDQPHRQVCSALTNNDLAASVGPDGRLSALLDAGASHPGADLTWVVDPALLGDVSTMTGAYEVGGEANCTGAVSERALPAATRWLSGLKQATAAQPTVITPYANVDTTALVHQGLTADLASAYTLGGQVARSVLGAQPDQSIAWPAGGTADLSVLTRLATSEHVSTVVLTSSQMPPSAGGVFTPDDAVASIHTEAGTPMTVLLADSTLTGVLADGDTSSGTLSPSTEFGVKQQFLAETAMIAAEAPDSARSVVVAPPQDWSPSQALADDLLSETTGAPWLKPATLSSLAAAPDTGSNQSRQSLPTSKDSPGELSSAYLAPVAQLGRQIDQYQAMLYKPSPSYVQSLDEALAATESAAWRRNGTVQGQAMLASLAQYMTDAVRKVRIITSPTVPMGGSQGSVPVAIQNGLSRDTVRVRVVVTVLDNPNTDRPSQLSVGRFQDEVLVPPGDAVSVRVPVNSAPQGPTQIQISLTTVQGTPLPVKTATITVESTRYGRAILLLIGAAIGILVLTSVYRAIRRWLRGDSHVAAGEAESPGSVGTGTSAPQPTEEPDDLADARRWVDDA